MQCSEKGVKWTEDCCGKMQRKPSVEGMHFHSASQIPSALVCFLIEQCDINECTFPSAQIATLFYVTWTCVLQTTQTFSASSWTLRYFTGFRVGVETQTILQ